MGGVGGGGVDRGKETKVLAREDLDITINAI